MFEIAPLSGYTLPRYGRMSLDALNAWAAWLHKRGALKLAALLLVAGLGLGGCRDDGKISFVSDGDPEAETSDTTDGADTEKEPEAVEASEGYDGLDGGIASENADTPTEADGECAPDQVLTCYDNYVLYIEDCEQKGAECRALCPSVDPQTGEALVNGRCSGSLSMANPCICTYGEIEGDIAF